MREAAQGFGLLEGQLPRLEIEHADRPERIAFGIDQRHAAIETEVGLASDHCVVGEALVLCEVGDGQEIALTDGGRACRTPWYIREVRRQPVFGLQPLASVGNDVDQANRALADLCC